MLDEGVHSGDASGVVPSSFRILRQLLDRIEDPETGEVAVADLPRRDPGAARPSRRGSPPRCSANDLDAGFRSSTACAPSPPSAHELVLNRTWRPALSVTGAGRPAAPRRTRATSCDRGPRSKLSLRLPPTADANGRGERLQARCSRPIPPYGAQCPLRAWTSRADGWDAPALAPWLEAAHRAARRRPTSASRAVYMGEGGSIPFMGMLGEKFPEASS